ncbi:uracil-DNA glycosylase family protein [Agarivorans sp.]|uniref:uracil-DNA glycosylase family protein n=1 Tax=Agarivorans sp. TaxID=1872412 RepID=UPI003D013FF1
MTCQDKPAEQLASLLKEIYACQLCQAQLSPRPVLQVASEAKILIIGQAPGSKVHQSGIPWDDVSGQRLREWMGVNEQQFYDAKLFAIIPAAFCYPGRGKQGDLAPPKICFNTWHQRLLACLANIELSLLVGQYAQALYLPADKRRSLTENVANYAEFAEQACWPLPHPSPRNRFWLAKHPWFTAQVLPELQAKLAAIIKRHS